MTRSLDKEQKTSSLEFVIRYWGSISHPLCPTSSTATAVVETFYAFSGVLNSCTCPTPQLFSKAHNPSWTILNQRRMEVRKNISQFLSKGRFWGIFHIVSENSPEVLSPISLQRWWQLSSIHFIGIMFFTAPFWLTENPLPNMPPIYKSLYQVMLSGKYKLKQCISWHVNLGFIFPIFYKIWASSS